MEQTPRSTKCVDTDFGAPGHPLGSCALFLSSAWGDPDSCLVIELSLNSLRQAPRPRMHRQSRVEDVGVANVPVDYVSPLDAVESSYVGRRRAAAPSHARRTAAAGRDVRRAGRAPSCSTTVQVAPVDARAAASRPELDTVSHRAGPDSLEPVDQTTSFEHEPTTRLPMLRAEPPTTAGKRRAVKHAGRPRAAVQGLPLRAGAHRHRRARGLGRRRRHRQRRAADGRQQRPRRSPTPPPPWAAPAAPARSRPARTDVSAATSDRDAQADAAGEDKLQAAADGQAEQREAELAQAGRQGRGAGQGHRQEPVASTRSSRCSLTARFGQYGLWSSYHTGLDFNGNTGDQIHSIANGVVISACYDGSYGNKTVVRLEDGTEIWYCHQTSFVVSVGRHRPRRRGHRHGRLDRPRHRLPPPRRGAPRRRRPGRPLHRDAAARPVLSRADRGTRSRRSRLTGPGSREARPGSEEL